MVAGAAGAWRTQHPKVHAERTAMTSAVASWPSWSKSAAGLLDIQLERKAKTSATAMVPSWSKSIGQQVVGLVAGPQAVRTVKERPADASQPLWKVMVQARPLQHAPASAQEVG